MKVLVTGISGLIGRLVAKQLSSQGHAVVGIDRRPWASAPNDIEVHTVDVRKRAAENVFRTFRPDAVVHLATVTHLDESGVVADRINLQGTRAVWEHCHAYEAKKAVFVGRHTYYGATPDAPLMHEENEPPAAISSLPELADLVAADLYAGSQLWRYPALDTVVLRLCYSLGPSRHGTLARYLRGPRVPMVLGFDPLIQFLHEEDVATAICTALAPELRGVFNVAGPPPLPLSVLVSQTGRKPLWLPEPLFAVLLRRFTSLNMSRGVIDHLKYPVIIDDEAFRKATGFAHRLGVDPTIESFRLAS
jgi:UDP-glucose 4-epimerase